MNTTRRTGEQLHMPRRESGSTDRWIVFKLPNTTPERWVTGPRGLGVYAQLWPRKRWLLFTTLQEAHNHARKATR